MPVFGDDEEAGRPPAHAGIRETHVAVVVFLGEHAYKIKKAVSPGFLDFSTAAARREACERELVLNRRFAPDVYLGLGEFRFPGGEHPEPVVVMRRMPEDRRLSDLVRGGAEVGPSLRDVARLLAIHHAQAHRGPEVDAQGSRAALSARWEENFAQVCALTADGGPGGDLATGGVPEARELVRRYLAGRGPLFDERIRRGRIVDGHGDLLAEDIFCLDDGPRVLDCLEFDDTLRFLDGLDDAACLAMDLEQLGAAEEAASFLARYSEYSGDPAPPSLRHHYVAYRAFVRCKVALVRAGQGDAAAVTEARRLLTAALRHLRTSEVALVLVGGLPGSGKSTLAGALADRLGVTLLSSDRVRKELAGIPPEQPAPAGYGQGLYRPEWTDRTYAALLERARALLAAGETVVADATWSDASNRDAAGDVARSTGSALVALRCEAPADTAAQRLATRGPGPSDAGAPVARAMAEAEDPWPDAVAVDTGGDLEAAVRQALAAVRPHSPEPSTVFRRSYMEPG
ncbi:bifunctional aminoglycoside phosphotransferase/ATP-binding protein [Streptomyces meridianus]|uniref:AAA family ATPase n=1 Tax=Streptomyces meridianus TaxID=2938945 RepID=A0ABT0X508_9ACTN|nr:bifunctional aminoglycoside phosphotransferase/ATP-binding protein [Streptomyces meridianus]MCM2577425.1 AAA family ATPase [Streptomyces meridianus]